MFPPLKTVEESQVQYTDRIVDVLVTVQRRVPTIQTTQRTVEVPQVQFLDRTVGVPVMTQRQAPQETIEETIEVPKIMSQDRIPQRTAEQVMDIPVPHVVEEFNEVFKVFFQNRVQQRVVEQITETPAVSLAEEIVETPKVQTQEKIICSLKKAPSEFLEERQLDVLVVTQRHAPRPSIPPKRLQERIVEEIIDVHVPRMMEKTI